jgi:hypothetical protein
MRAIAASLCLVVLSTVSGCSKNPATRLEEIQHCRRDIQKHCFVKSDLSTLREVPIADVVRTLGPPEMCRNHLGDHIFPSGPSCPADWRWVWKGFERPLRDVPRDVDLQRVIGDINLMCALDSQNRCLPDFLYSQ